MLRRLRQSIRGGFGNNRHHNASPEEIERVRKLTQRIIAVMESAGASDVRPVEHGAALIAAEAAA